MLRRITECGIQIEYALVVEAHPIVAASIANCIEACFPGVEVAVAPSLAMAGELLASRPAPLLVVADLAGEPGGLFALGRLRTLAQQSPLLVLSALDDPESCNAAMALGATAYLERSVSVEKIVHAINAIVRAAPVTVRPRQVRTDTPGGVLAVLLTPKQMKVLEALPSGRSNREIGSQLRMGEETVRSHMKEILARLGVRNRTEVVAVYLRMLQDERDAS